MSSRPPEEPGDELDSPQPSFAIGTTGMGIPDEALAAGETLEDELVSDEGEAALIRAWPYGRRQG